MQQEALVGNCIVHPKLPPQCVWDLYSNWVVPFWVSDIHYRGYLPPLILHRWMDEKDHINVMSLINRYKWPVPIPKNTSLNFIQIKMLNLGAQYMWLDVLCVRQKGGPKKDLHAQEWKLDMPMIRRLYRGQKVVIYLSGLGLPLSVKKRDMDSDKCWFRCPWTLQEVGKRRRLIARDTTDELMHNNDSYITGLKMSMSMWIMLHLLGLVQGFWDLFSPLEEMRNQVSTNPVNKVAGLTFPLFPQTIPTYNESESLEDA
ncbi:hypothetical protein EDD85DRAFT_760214 [Armillaria nabsnona]|nr:hypothetical protein EDD85DRAFT_760214 [Armillaria nabsnona]